MKLLVGKRAVSSDVYRLFFASFKWRLGGGGEGSGAFGFQRQGSGREGAVPAGDDAVCLSAS